MYNTTRAREKQNSFTLWTYKRKTYNNNKIHRLLELVAMLHKAEPLYPQLHYLKRIMFALQVRVCVDLGLVVGFTYAGAYNTLLSSICVMFRVADLDYST